MSIKRFAQTAFFVLCTLTLVACGGSTKNGFVRPPQTGKVDLNTIELSTTISKANKIGEKLVGTTWEGKITVGKCKNTEVELDFVKWARTSQLIRVVARSTRCPVLSGRFLGTIHASAGEVAVRSGDKKRMIFMVPNLGSGVAKTSLTISSRGYGKVDAVFTKVVKKKS